MRPFKAGGLPTTPKQRPDVRLAAGSRWGLKRATHPQNSPARRGQSALNRGCPHSRLVSTHDTACPCTQCLCNRPPRRAGKQAGDPGRGPLLSRTLRQLCCVRAGAVAPLSRMRPSKRRARAKRASPAAAPARTATQINSPARAEQQRLTAADRPTRSLSGARAGFS